ncbi:ankyrin repeat domain-containing protein [Psychrobacter phenylpyruvicus]|uniref:Ankyrin repeats (3 copies) n=1 Tax=Psychrobacter phenylpyruvicus TaxID=29432 RepID=A0A379LLE2_9GAMM|nr:ankyrin repeat domain-containing protein [Psychrobacter phenylpyruvicus]SUD90602.1 Ankyrin repeats (3 copies) [Psychrobacter phenylpyruvicus]
MDEYRKLRLNVFSLFSDGKLEKAAKLFKKNGMDYFETSPTDKWNWLHQLLMGFNSDTPPRKTIEFFIHKGVPVNAQDVYGMTPLHYAMRGKNAEAAIALLEAGADPNIPNRDNVIPLAMIGGMPERLDVLKLMLEKGGNPNYINANNDISIVKSLKKHVGNVDQFKPVIELLEKYS